MVLADGSICFRSNNQELLGKQTSYTPRVCASALNGRLQIDMAAFVAERLWLGGGRTLAKPQGVVQARTLNLPAGLVGGD